MDRQKFESIVQTYGADTERWPHAHRADMLALLDTDPQARAILGQEAALDSLLGAMEPPVSDTLEARIRNDMAATLGAQTGWACLFRHLPYHPRYHPCDRRRGLLWLRWRPA